VLRPWLTILALWGCGRVDFDAHREGSADSAGVRGCVATFTGYGDQVCALRSDGALYCWGSNARGQLGDGSFVDRTTPTPVPITEVDAVASGEYTVCAVRGDGALWCWGANDQGQLGDGSLTTRALPELIPLPARVHAVAIAQTHACAILDDGNGWCWGDNQYGELGYDTPAMQLVPQPSPPLSGNVAMTLGDNVTCAIRSDGSLVCWGRDEEGELGDGLTASRSTLMRVAAIADPIASAAGGCHRHLCAATSTGEVWCWGENMHGELGTGSISAFETIPVRVAGVPDAVQVAVGAFHTCARTRAGEIWCWGDNANGQLGDGTFEPRPSPVRVAGFIGTPVDLQASCSDTAVLRDDATLVSWGGFRLLGTGATLNQPTPVEVPVPCP